MSVTVAIGLGVALVADRDTLGGVAAIGAGVALIGPGVAVLREELASWFHRLTTAPGTTEVADVGEAHQHHDQGPSEREQTLPPH